MIVGSFYWDVLSSSKHKIVIGCNIVVSQLYVTSVEYSCSLISSYLLQECYWGDRE